MAEVYANKPIEVTRWEIDHKNTFHFKKLYKYMHDWWKDLGYRSETGDDKFETFYFERQKADGSKEQWMWWRLFKTPNSSKYFRYKVTFDIQTLGVKKVDVVASNGKKMSSDVGTMTIRCGVELEIDYSKSLSTNPIVKHFYRWFRERLLVDRIDYYKKELHSDAFLINSWAKQYLERLVPKNPEPPLFQTPKGV